MPAAKQQRYSTHTPPPAASPLRQGRNLISFWPLVTLSPLNCPYNKKGHPFKMSFFIKVAMTYSPTNLCSTIGAVGLNFSVRDGKRWIPDAINRLNKGYDTLISYNVKVFFMYFPLWKLLFSLSFYVLSDLFVCL